MGKNNNTSLRRATLKRIHSNMNFFPVIDSLLRQASVALSLPPSFLFLLDSFS